MTDNLTKQEHAVDKRTTDNEEGVIMGWMPPWFYDSLVYIFTLGREVRQRREILALADIQSGERVLDIGCGTGSLAILAACETKASQVLGVDPSESFIQCAKNKAGDRFPKNHLNFEVGKGQSLPDSVKSNAFDVIFSTFAFHHLPGDDLQEQVLSEMKRVLAPGGRLVIVDFPNHGHNSSTTHQHEELSSRASGLFQHCREICSGGSHDKIDSDQHERNIGLSDLSHDHSSDDPLTILTRKAGFENITVQRVSMMGAMAILAC